MSVRIQFDPALSDEKTRAIATTRFGSYIKVHFGLAPQAAKLWEENGESILTLLCDSPAGSIYDATDLQEAPADRDRILTLLIHAVSRGPWSGIPLTTSGNDLRRASTHCSRE